MDKNWSAKTGPWRGEGIAIVGIAGRFPKAQSAEAFWQNLCDGRDCISEFTREEMLRDGVAPATLDHAHFVPAGAVLEDIELFDAQFFGISPREAQSLDPQLRIFLEVVQHAFDDAGIDPQRFAGPIGMYAGTRLSTYWLQLMDNDEIMRTLGWHQVSTGNDKDFLPTQASFRFGLHGPSVNVQTACSTSLVAVSLACDALVLGHCDAAVAGASSVSIPQHTGYIYQPSGIASADGKCRPFDAGASGSVLGNGVGAVVLKRIGDALRSGDRIYATIRSVAVNNDGKRKSSFAAPSVKGQTDVINSAIARAGIAPSWIGYVEAHGTATQLGDPIEVEALARTIGNSEARAEPCGIGSVKSNIGHLDPAASIASLIKVAFSLHHGVIPPSLHYVQPNPAIDFAKSGVRVVSETQEWPRIDHPRYAGVSSFGIGGTNAHAILGEAPIPSETPSRRSHYPLMISAKSADALKAAESQIAKHLRDSPHQALADVAFTLACGRSAFQYRRAIVAATAQEAATKFETGRIGAPRSFQKHRDVVFLFPGQGSQYPHMGLDLYRHEPAFKAALNEAFRLAEPYLGFDPLLLVDPPDDGAALKHDVNQTAIAQPLIFCVGYAASQLWRHWGVTPAVMLGHSIGELVAAQAAGVLSLPDAVRVACERGRLMQQMPQGMMLAVLLEEPDAMALETEDLRISAFNGPKQHSISGPAAAIEALEETLRARGVKFSRLATSHAFHHPLMADAAAQLEDILHGIQLNTPRIPFISCLTGQLISDEQATSSAYWAQCVVQPVRFSAGVRHVLGTPDRVFIECGPGQVVGNMMRAHGLDSGAVIVNTLSNKIDSRSDRECALEALGSVWESGVTIDWEKFWDGEQRQRVKLPSYPFQRQRYWVELPMKVAADAPQAGLTQPGLANPCYGRIWQPFPLKKPVRTAVDGTWIILADTFGLGIALSDRLRNAGARAVSVLPGAYYQNPAENVYCVNPSAPREIEKLVANLALKPGDVHVVNAWVAGIPQDQLTVDRGELGALLSLTAPLQLLRALASVGAPAVSLRTLTTGLYSIGYQERTEPVIAPAIGLTRVLPQEVRGLRAQLIDFGVTATAGHRQMLLDNLLDELLTDATEPIVAYRNGTRLCEGFSPIPLPDEARLADFIHPHGTYLITGGFGGMGGVFASAIANTARVNLALVGRHAIKGADDERSQAARSLVRALQANGAEVLPLAADVSDRAQIEQAVSEIETRFGRIHGVIHAAGVPGGRMLMASDTGQDREVLAPKVNGTIALLNRIASHQPDFVVLTSSFAAIVGGVGQGAYTAANAFLDAAAIFARGYGLRAISINWPAWRDVGMAHSMSLPPELEYMREASLAAGITPDEGVHLLTRIIASDVQQVIVPPSAKPHPGAAMVAPAVKEAQPTPSHKTTSGEMSPVSGDAGEALASQLAVIWHSVLGVPEVRPSDNFFELGGQSLLALRVVSAVAEQFPIQLELTDLLNYPTLEQFAALVYQRLVDAVSAMPEERVQRMLGEV